MRDRCCSWFSSAAYIGLLAALSACAQPYQSQTLVSPSIDPCRYKTYSFLAPQDQTATHWLDNPDHVKALEDILRDQLNKRGLHEVAAGKESPDLQIRQLLQSIASTADRLKLGTWRVELLQTADTATVWSFQIDMVIDTIDRKNLAAARAQARESFAGDYPRCRNSH
jgi:hypothetical protein